jgi:peptidoglycan/xylan/chitin deacetylase (PgdA/CDA1 family)
MSQDKNLPPEVPKKMVAITAVFLSACVAIYAFWIFNEIERRIVNRQTQNPQNQELLISASDGVTETHAEIIDDETSVTGGNAEGFFHVNHTVLRDIQHFPAPVVKTPGYQDAPRTARAYLQHAEKAGGVRGLPYTVNNGSLDKKLIALTFDGGSSANATLDILDTLASRGVKSTMFLTGSFIRRFPQIVMRIADEGHELANHTMNHPRMTTYSNTKTQTTRPEISRQTVINELVTTERLLAERTGLSFAPLWRSPYGEYNREICRWALDAGYLHIGWKKGRTWWENLDSNDWVTDENSPSFKTPDEVFYKIINMASQPQGANGGIVLMHLGTERKEREMQVHLILGKLIDTLREIGYEAVTVSELLYQSEIDISGLTLQKEQLTYRN